MPLTIQDLDLCAEAAAAALHQYGLDEEFEALQAARDLRRTSEITRYAYHTEIDLAWRAAQAFEALSRRKGL